MCSLDKSRSNGMIPYHHQWLAALALCLGAILSGTTAGWTSPYIAKLTASDCTHRLKLTPSEASWVAALRSVGRLFGTILGATIQGFIGRKKTLLCLCIPQVIGWSLIILAPSVSWLYVSRIFTGMSAGMVYTASASFLGEIADPKIRGSLITLIPNGMITGMLLGVTIGGFLSMETFSYICLGLTGLFFAAFVSVPESPYYHIAKGNLQKAEKSVRWYKNDGDVQREIDEVQNMLERTGVSLAEVFNEFKKQEHRRNFFLIYLLSALPYCAGMGTTEGYSQIILTKSKTDFNPSVAVMVLTFCGIVAGFVPIVLVDKIGRRSLLMGSGFGLTVGHVLLGSHFHLLSLGVQPQSINWLPVVSLFLVYFSTPCGLATVRDSLLGELFPPILKTPASFLFTTSTAISSFAVAKSFQSYVDFVGEKYVFWTFATVALCSVGFSYFFIPKTTRMNLIAIQDNLKRNIKESKVSAASMRLIPLETSKTLTRPEVSLTC